MKKRNLLQLYYKNWEEKMKKILITFLCAIMVMVFMPTMAFAAENDVFEVTKNGETTTYSTAVDAVASVANGETATIKLLDDYSGGGVKVDGTGKNITFDLNGFTWTIGTPLVGSAGTETNAFQLLKDNTVTFQNGTITSNIAKILFQNYANLTLDNVEASLTTEGTGYYAASNNNGTTLIKGGTVITVPEGNYAMDSFTFGDYAGGNVVVEDASIMGDVEVANGGKLTLKGGLIYGDVTVYNYKYDQNVEKQSQFTMETGIISGDLKTSEKGITIVNNGMVEGTVDLEPSKGATATIKGGYFNAIGDAVAVDSDVVVDFDAEGEILSAVGDTAVSQLLSSLEEVLTPEELALVKLNVEKAPAEYKMDVPVGITVVNNTENDINVNDQMVEANGELTVTAPDVNEGTDDTKNPPTTDDEKDPVDEQKPVDEEKTDDEVVKTADANDMLPWLALMAVMAIGVVLTAVKSKKREN